MSDFPKLSVTALFWWAKGRRPLGPPKSLAGFGFLPILATFSAGTVPGLSREDFAYAFYCLRLGAHKGGHATTRFLEGFLESSLNEVLLRRVLRRCLVRA